MFCVLNETYVISIKQGASKAVCTEMNTLKILFISSNGLSHAPI